MKAHILSKIDEIIEGSPNIHETLSQRELALGSLEDVSETEINNKENFEEIIRLTDLLIDYDNINETALTSNELKDFPILVGNLLNSSIDF